MAEATQGDHVTSEPKGLGGWMILPTLGTFASPLFLGKAIFDVLSPMLQPDYSKHELSIKIVLAGELVVNFLLLCAWVYAIVLLLKRSARFPRVFSLLLIIGLIVIGADTVIGLSYLNIQPDASTARDLMRGLIGVLIWVPYMFRSKRVANTFVN